MKMIARFNRLSRADKSLLLEAVLFSYAAKITLCLLPFKRCLWLLQGTRHEAENPGGTGPGQIKKAIYRSRYGTPWNNKCLTMSMASRWMLQRRRIPSRLFLGVAFDDERKLKAHAWLGTRDLEVVERGAAYQPLYQV